MEDTEERTFLGDNSGSLLGGLILGGFIIVFVYAANKFARSRDIDVPTKNVKDTQRDKHKEEKAAPVGGTTSSAISNKRAKNKKRREAQQEFTHSWMIGTLKGHTNSVHDMNFSGNGKLLISSGEDGPRPEEPSRNKQRTEERKKKRLSVPEPSSSGAASTTHATDRWRKLEPADEREDERESLTSTSSSKISSLDQRQWKERYYRDQQQALRYRRERQGAAFYDGREQDSRYRERQEQRSCCYEEEERNLYDRAYRYDDPYHRQEFIGHRPPMDVPGRDDSFEEDYGTSDGTGSPDPPSDESTERPRASFRDCSRKKAAAAAAENYDDTELVRRLREYALTSEEMQRLGYPVRHRTTTGYTVIIDHREYPVGYRLPQRLDANAREFVPNRTSDVIASVRSNDSGNGSGNSAESSDQETYSDSDKASDVTDDSSSISNILGYRHRHRKCCRRHIHQYVEETPKREDEHGNVYLIRDPNEGPRIKAKCARCSKIFHIDRKSGEYLEEEDCVYHWGKLRSRSLYTWEKQEIWDCCGRDSSSIGCTLASLHVWTGLLPGYNGPFDDFVSTGASCSSIVSSNDGGNLGIYALDCEMCFTRFGLELCKVTLVDTNGKVVYDTLVQPDHEVIDYNTRFSGITAINLAGVTTTLKDVQEDITEIIDGRTILIGHGLENDLRVLRMTHATVIDTCVAFPHHLGYPFRSSLKTLARTILGREIQGYEHDSVEDARVTLDLMIWKIQHDTSEKRHQQPLRPIVV